MALHDALESAVGADFGDCPVDREAQFPILLAQDNVGGVAKPVVGDGRADELETHSVSAADQRIAGADRQQREVGAVVA